MAGEHVDLIYPPSISASLERLGQTLGGISVADEIAACRVEPDLWGPGNAYGTEPAASPLAQFAEFRALGTCAFPLGDLLPRVGRAYVPLPLPPRPALGEGGRGGEGLSSVALAWPDPTAPWHPGDELTAVVNPDGTVSGTVGVAPFCMPARGLAFLAQAGSEVALVECGAEATQVGRVGDAYQVGFDTVLVRRLEQGDDALRAWGRAVLWERLALVGLTVGLIDRAYDIAMDALGEGQRQERVLAGEQGAQFQLADNYIDRMAAERLAQDVAIDAERGRPVDAKLALVRYHTAGQAERSAARALHLASLFLPHLVPIARWLTHRAHHLSVFGVAREHEVRLAAAGLAAGLRLE